MANTCGHCSRVNPPGATYCYHDGNSLGHQGAAGPQNIGAQPFPAPFVFPSGRACKSFDQFALACLQEWAAAVRMLRDGYFERFLGGLGRMDLALAARTAAAYPDTDRGLDQFLERLPTQAVQPPKLRVEPTEVNLGTLRPDATQRVELHLANQGMRLLYGTVVSDSPWLTLGDDPGQPQKIFQCSTETVIPATVHARQLRAGNRPLEAKLIVESNGGTVMVRFKALVPAKPFPEGVLAGALSPRQLAEKARSNPKEAARFFESGAVARWYQQNGWPYPVQGPAATGLGAVQQFFEALGLAKVPRVEISEQLISLRGRPGEPLQHPVQVRTSEKRPVFASAVSDQPWLVAGPVQLNGPVATIPLAVPRVPDQSGQLLSAQVVVTANGGQRFVVRVSLAVAALGHNAAGVVTPLPVDTAVTPITLQPVRPLPPPMTPVHKSIAEPAATGSPDGASAKLYLLLGGGVGVVLLLLLAVLLLLPDPEPPEVVVAEERKEDNGGAANNQPIIEDLPEEVFEAKGATKYDIKDEPEERAKDAPPLVKPKVEVQIKDEPEEGTPVGGKGKVVVGPIDPQPRVLYQYGPNMRFGIIALKDSVGKPLNKRLTYSPDGSTSNTRVKIDGLDGEYGSPAGRWLVANKRLPIVKGRPTKNGTVSILVIGKVHISQFVEIVPSKQPVLIKGVNKRVFDTVLVRYRIENKDNRAHSVGVRVQVDTLIGSNDGVPFTVPGLPGLVNDTADFRSPQEVPSFIQALERSDLANPGTVANMTLKPGGGLEPPSRVSLTHWSGGAPWEVAVRNLSGDSAVIIYWNPTVLEPGQKREVGYAYGLGRVDAGEGGKLGLVLGGEFEPGKVFTVTAQVVNPVAGQTLTLEAPAGLLVLDTPKRSVPAGMESPPTSVVTWNVKVLKTGEHRVRVRSSTGVAVSKTISITQQAGPTGGQLALEIEGRSFEPGQVFTVLARVTDPVPGQKLTLELPPRGLDRAAGAEIQNVPPADKAGGVSTASWKVKIVTAGQFKVRVKSSTGVIQTKTLTIVQQKLTGGAFRLALSGEFAPGKVFNVRAFVADPVPDQALTLKLPPKLELVKGPARQNVPGGAEKGASAEVAWAVKVREAGTYLLAVESTTGSIRPMTLTILPTDAGKFVLEFSGKIAPAKEFEVIARVTNPIKGQQLTLELAEKLKRTGGEATQGVGPDGTVRWKVRVAGTGSLRVRVVCPMIGSARSRTITITEDKAKTGSIF